MAASKSRATYFALPWERSVAYSRLDAEAAASTVFFGPSPRASTGASTDESARAGASKRSSADRERRRRGAMVDGEFIRFGAGRLLRERTPGYSRPPPRRAAHEYARRRHCPVPVEVARSGPAVQRDRPPRREKVGRAARAV